MQISPAHVGALSLRSPVWAQPRSAAAPEEPPKETGQKDDKDTETAAERWSRRVGQVAEGLTKIPKALLFIPSFLKFAVFDTLIPLLGFTATMGGLVGTVALGAAGALETLDGAKRKDAAVVLSGLGEMARGGYVGALSWNSWQSGSFTPGGAGVAFGLVHGALNLSSGIVKMRRPDREDKITGALEAGMGIAAAATLCAPDPLKVPMLVLNGLLAGSRSIYMNREQIQDWRVNHRQKLHDEWEKFKNIFREEKKAEHAGP